ncbi:MAG: phosphoribosylglycinamide formyltransferase [Bacillota bacterium]|nr:phosphoribosylglycinamide formyltransferase [Bacillota bacterium]HHU43552.1 phosphoribosylglycinamide formyltransferase [Clostridiales bacterium]
MKNIAVFVSGSGTNLQAIIDSIKLGQIKNARISLVVASKEGIYALERAKRENIPALIYKKANYPSLDKMFEEITIELEKRQIDLIVLAGYLLILTPNIVKRYRNRIINIHPSLIPKYSGDGFYGMKVHKAVIENKEEYSGATVHFVDEGTDTGEIILQERVKVYENDTPETLAERVLELEHKLYAKAINKIINGDENEKKSID